MILLDLKGQVIKSTSLSVNSVIKEKILKIPKGVENKYGFTNRSQLDSIQIGNVINTYEINFKDSSIVARSQVLYPIMLKNKILFFAKGTRLGNEIDKIHGIGGNILAQQINSTLEKMEVKDNYALLELSDFNTFLIFDEKKVKYREALKLVSFTQITCSQCLIDEYQIIDFYSLMTIIINKSFKKYEDEKITN